MNDTIAISREDAIAKFGHHFIVESENNRFGYKIVEKLGKENSIFDDEDDNMSFEEACGKLQGRVLIDATRKTIDNKILKEEFSSKIDLFLYRRGWMKAAKMEKIKRFLDKDATLQENLTIDIDCQALLVSLPDTMYLPKKYFETDKIYYQFKHSHSIHQNSEIFEVKPSSIDISLDESNLISMCVSFVNLSGEQVDGHVSYWDFKEFNSVDYDKPYVGTGYSNIFLFVDKNDCKQFAVDKIKNDIDHFEKSLAALL